MHSAYRLLVLFIPLLVLAGCKKEPAKTEGSASPEAAEQKDVDVSVVHPQAVQIPRLCNKSGEKPSRIASAPFEPRSGSKSVGWAEFLECSDGVHVEVRAALLQLKPRAVHIHEVGDCSDPDAAKAGLPFNPELGNLGNATPVDSITVGLNTTVQGANLREGDPASFLNRSVILYFDDVDQPSTRDSRIGCGVIKPGELSREVVLSVYPAPVLKIKPPVEEPAPADNSPSEEPKLQPPEATPSETPSVKYP